MIKKRLLLNKDITTNQNTRKLSFDFGYLESKYITTKPIKFQVSSLTQSAPIHYINPSKMLQLNPSSVANVIFSVTMSNNQKKLVTKSNLNTKKASLNMNVINIDDEDDTGPVNEPVTVNLNVKVRQKNTCGNDNNVIYLNEEIENGNKSGFKLSNANKSIGLKIFEEDKIKDERNIIINSKENNIIIAINRDCNDNGVKMQYETIINPIANNINIRHNDNESDSDSDENINNISVDSRSVDSENKTLLNELDELEIGENDSDFTENSKLNNNPIEVIDLVSSMSDLSIKEVRNNIKNDNDNKNNSIINLEEDLISIEHISESESMEDTEEDEDDVDQDKDCKPPLESTELMLIYTYQITNTIKILWKDYYSLNPKSYVNDIIINFYLRFIEENINNPSTNKTLIMNSYFYTLISKDDKGQMNEILKSYSFNKKYNRVDIFSNDYIIVPIYDHMHWSLIIIISPYKMVNLDKDNSTKQSSILDISNYPIIIYLDSYFDSNSKCIKIMKKYLCCEYIRTRNTDSFNDILQLQTKSYMIHSIAPKMPKQPNSFDCGIFLLAYCELFLCNPNYFVEKIKRNVIDMENCFDAEHTNLKRKEIQRLIKKLIKEQSQSLNEEKIVDKTEKKKKEKGSKWYITKLQKQIKGIFSKG